MIKCCFARQMSSVRTVNLLLLRLSGFFLGLLLEFLLPLLFLLLCLLYEHLIRGLLWGSRVKIRPILKDVKRRLHGLLVIQFGDLVLDLLLDEVFNDALGVSRRLFLEL